MGKKQKLEEMKKKYQKFKVKLAYGYVWKRQYYHYLESCKIQEKTILLESQHGGSLGGNIFALMKELCENPAYAGYKICFSCKKEQMETKQDFLKKNGMERVHIIRYGMKEYYKTLASAKYLINDNTFIHLFIKRPEQVYFNTWHGTPFKTLGKKIKNDFAGIGNAQHNMIMADYLLYPNRFTMEHMVEDYMLPNLSQGKILLSGYPRNTAFLSEGRREQIRKEYDMDGKEIYAYLPTWRGVVGKVTSKQQNERLYKYLEELDEKLSEHQRVYVKLHPISVKEIDLSRLKRIVPFPTDTYDTYEFLNATDGLITDYSSIFFDYAVSGKKIILFAYDKQEYIADRGFYFSMDELPFPQTETVDELLACMNAPKSYDDTEFLKTFCTYENPGVTAALLRRVIFGEPSGLLEELPVPDNGKKNVVVYAGALKDNKITSAAMQFLNTVDKEKTNYILTYKIEDLKKNLGRLRPLSEEVAHIGYYDNISLSFAEMVIYKLWRDYRLLPYCLVKGIIRKKAGNESKRMLGGCRVDEVVQFTGYSADMIAAFQAMPCHKVIFVHNNMEKETKKKRGLDKKLLRDAYRSYDVVAVTDRRLTMSLENIAGRDKINHLQILPQSSEYTKVM